MESESFISTLRRRAWIVVLFAVLGVALGAVPQPQQAQDATISYTATHVLLLSSSNGNLYTDPVQLNQIVLFASTGEVPQRVAAKLGMGIGEVAVSAGLDQSSGALSIQADRPDGKSAELIANAVADELAKYIVERQDRQSEDRLATNLARQKDLATRIHSTETAVAAKPGDNVLGAELEALRAQLVITLQRADELSSDTGLLTLTTLQPATAAAVQSQGLQAPRSRTTRGVLAGLVGAAIGTGLALLIGRFDRRVRTRAQAEALVGLAAQVIVPTANAESLVGVAVVPSRNDALSDSFRALRTVVSFVEGGEARDNGRAPIIVVVSAGQGDGKTSVSANLAAAFMESGNKTVAVNTDFRRPALVNRILGMNLPALGFTLPEAMKQSPVSLLSRTLYPNLALLDLASIKAAPGELARLTARVLPDIANVCDAVVVDTSPITATAEVLDIIPVADVVVLAVRLNQTPTAAISRSIELIRSLQPKHLLLVVVGGATERSSYYDYGDNPKPGRRWKRKSSAA
jgi:Mrp family chromosome partitioning ATPase/capsular polysaccharide biosynthesis protein